MRCPCGRSADYEACCGRFIDGHALPERPAQLMRSRYTAFVLERMDWLDATVPPEMGGHAVIPRTWLGLEILRVEQGKPGDEEGLVEFKAHYRLPSGVEETLHERSTFHRVDGRWLYVGGEHKPDAVGRNSPCPCGSGRKYKRCCGR